MFVSGARFAPRQLGGNKLPNLLTNPTIAPMVNRWSHILDAQTQTMNSQIHQPCKDTLIDPHINLTGNAPYIQVSLSGKQ